MLWLWRLRRSYAAGPIRSIGAVREGQELRLPLTLPTYSTMKNTSLVQVGRSRPLTMSHALLT